MRGLAKGSIDSTVRGLPKNQYRVDEGGGEPVTFGTVEYIDGGGATGTSITVSTMAEDEMTILVGGVSGNSWMYSMGYGESETMTRTLQIGHNGNGWESVHMGICEPLPAYAGSHDTSINWAIGSGDNPAWCRARFRKGTGFRGDLVASERVNQNSQTDTFTITPFTNPMTEPGGICLVGAFKDYTSYPTTVTGTGWNKGGNGGLTIQGYYILSTSEIETPGNVSLYGATARYWAGMVAYLR
jgi:hypothetical protein